MWWKWLALVPVTVVFAACATIPSGPSVLVLPGTGKPFDLFQAEDATCRSWARQQVEGSTPGEAATRSLAATAALGTVAGAAGGAAIGAATGNPAAGAAIGAGAGFLGGSAIGAGAAQWSAGEVQQRYDVAYIQCMYARGNRVPVPGGLAVQPSLPPLPPPVPAK